MDREVDMPDAVSRRRKKREDKKERQLHPSQIHTYMSVAAYWAPK